MTYTTLTRRLQKKLRLLWQRRMPQGMISVCFLWPGNNRCLHLHRALPTAINARRRTFWRGMNILLWLRWIAFYAWRHADRAVQQHGELTQQLTGLPTATQRKKILTLALLHSIPPSAWYRYQLWSRPDAALWQYVYDHELPQFHQIYNGNLQGEGAQLLADKQRCAERFAAAGIATVTTLATLQPGAFDALLELLQQHHQLFCKPQYGSASRGAFALRINNDDIEYNALGATPLRGEQAVTAMRQALAAETYLLQPLLQQAGFLALSEQRTNEVATVRVLTRTRHRHDRHRHNNSRLLCAYLEIPLNSENRQYAFIAIDADTGALQTEGDNWHYHMLRRQHPQLLASLHGKYTEGWSDITNNALCAHALVSDIHVVAWDFVVSDNGALLLEGNVNWRVSVPQMLFGPLLPQLFS